MNLDTYTPWFHEYCGNDLQALERAHKRARFALRGIMLVGHRELKVAMKEPLPARDIERLQELLTTGSLLKYEQVREDYAGIVEVLPPTKEWNDIRR